MKIYRTVGNDTQVVKPEQDCMTDVILNDCELLDQIGADWEIRGLGGNTFAIDIEIDMLKQSIIYTT